MTFIFIWLKNVLFNCNSIFSELPMAEILMLCGFFMIYIVEEFTHALVDKFHKNKKVHIGDPKTGHVRFWNGRPWFGFD